MKGLPAQIDNDCYIVFNRPEVARRYLSRYKNKRVNIEIKEVKKQTTNEQYGYLFGVVLEELCKFTGYTQKEMMEIIKDEFHFEIKELNGKVYKVHKSISRKKSDIHILKDLIDKIIMWSAEIGCIIPEADSQDKWWIK